MSKAKESADSHPLCVGNLKFWLMPNTDQKPNKEGETSSRLKGRQKTFDRFLCDRKTFGFPLFWLWNFQKGKKRKLFLYCGFKKSVALKRDLMLHLFFRWFDFCNIFIAIIELIISFLKLLEQRQNKNDSIQSKIIPILKLTLFFPHRIGGIIFYWMELFLYCLGSRNYLDYLDFYGF